MWIAKKLRSLWNSGCDIQIIYSVSSRPVMSILRNGSGRGAIPVRQSVITNGKREIVKYNHSKWMTITGRFGGSTGTYVTMSGSANWSLFAFPGDEQVQTITAPPTRPCGTTGRSAHLGPGQLARPGFGIKGQRAVGRAHLADEHPEGAHVGQGHLQVPHPRGRVILCPPTT